MKLFHGENLTKISLKISLKILMKFYEICTISEQGYIEYVKQSKSNYLLLLLIDVVQLYLITCLKFSLKLSK